MGRRHEGRLDVCLFLLGAASSASAAAASRRASWREQKRREHRAHRRLASAASAAWCRRISCHPQGFTCQEPSWSAGSRPRATRSFFRTTVRCPYRPPGARINMLCCAAWSPKRLVVLLCRFSGHPLAVPEGTLVPRVSAPQFHHCRRSTLAGEALACCKHAGFSPSRPSVLHAWPCLREVA